MARELGLPITIHIAMGKLAGKWSMLKQLDTLGLLGPDMTYIHSCYLSDEEWELVEPLARLGFHEGQIRTRD